jgi:heme-degrading monooxygenase HmoA
MMTIVTTIRLKEGAQQEWDTVMRERLAAARKQPGWVGGQLLRPENQTEARIIVGTWRTKGDWEKWHGDPEFAETRQRLDGLSSEEPQHAWHEVVDDVRRAGPTSRRTTAGSSPGPRARGEARSS